ncbi:hypothetical protein K469DRAFT_70415 [Zopfia rhizophila CBS 207.26]|uniref:Uncharacterized protein n=1 Tax=Zopfia rhizophila CBS 207.26 TaxID=1314779 RepID=A0A6A6EDY0_9PEZI|nr:hypothetical protein K469DRAFT_70415 [Zopfia rhizophila CBS 207.26]
MRHFSQTSPGSEESDCLAMAPDSPLVTPSSLSYPSCTGWVSQPSHTPSPAGQRTSGLLPATNPRATRLSLSFCPDPSSTFTLYSPKATFAVEGRMLPIRCTI